MSTPSLPNDKFVPATFIKDIAIELPSDFCFKNLPQFENTSSQDQSSIYIPRNEQEQKLLEMLSTERGVYLVTGYRGMGKTTFVNKVLHDLKLREQVNNRACGTNQSGKKSTKKDVQQIRITVAQKQPTETELLKLMVSTIWEKCHEFYDIENNIWWRNLLIRIIKLLLALFIPLFLLLLFKSDDIENVFFVDHPSVNGPGVKQALDILKQVMIVSGLLAVTGLMTYGAFFIIGTPSEFIEIDKLFRRCHAVTSVENDNRTEIDFKDIATKVAMAGRKHVENYPIASSKEIEHLLITFLQKKIKKTFSRTYLKFIFIFDELDKVELISIPQQDDGSLNEYVGKLENAYMDQLRERKQAILNILAGLKNFLTTANAPFIFIAGREMFDASMADISDRQSSLSSIFNYVFYIESFLKQKSNGSTSLSTAIERYLYYLLYKEDLSNSSKSGKSFLTALYKSSSLNEQKDRDNYLKINLTMQNFVVYLTYRSNGSPKKLIRLIHEFVSKKPVSISNDVTKIVWENQLEQNKISSLKERYYLYFDYRQQQRLGFVSYIYRPFLVKYGNSFKNYSDDLVVSTSYLFDHLLKFHPFAFSYSHLELLPEVLSTNRTPALKEHIHKIVDYLLNNHIKETEIGLFDYKFYSKTVNEIHYLSKTFDEESAAFNFTLDESHLIKLHLKGRLRELRATYQTFTEDLDDMSRVVLSIAQVNGMLGDLHFFDQEYHEAISAYSDVIKPIRSLNVNNMNFRDFMLLIRYKLKLGLTFEKMRSFDESLAFYSDAAQDARRFLSARLRTSAITSKNLQRASGGTSATENFFLSSNLSDLLQLVNQAFIAKIVLQEKMSAEGITSAKSAITMGSFLHLAKSMDEQQELGLNTVIVSNLYLQIGNLLYLKNSVKAFENIKDNEYFEPYYRKELSEMIERHEKLSKRLKYRHPVTALNMYCLGLKYLLEKRVFDLKWDAFEEGNVLKFFLERLDPDEFRKHNNSVSKIHFKYIAIYLSSIGDCLLSMLKRPDGKKIDFEISEIVDTKKLRNLAEAIASNKTTKLRGPEDKLWIREVRTIIANDLELTPDEITQLQSQYPNEFPVEFFKLPKVQKLTIIDTYLKGEFERLLELDTHADDRQITVQRIICYYYLSAHYFKKSSRSRSYGFQLRKIFYVIRLLIRENQEGAATDDFIYILERVVLKAIVEEASRTAQLADINDVGKFKAHMEDGINQHSIGPVSLTSIENAELHSNVSNFPDTKEAALLLFHIKLKLQGNSKTLLDAKAFSSNFSISTQYFRLVELTCAAKFYEKRMKNILNPAGIPDLKDIISYLHSLVGVISIMEIYDNDYLVGYSFLAYHHFRLAKFFSFENGKPNDFNVCEKMAKEARDQLLMLSQEKGFSIGFDKDYHFKMAADLYDKAIKLHSAGEDYKTALGDIIYLEDDLSDGAYHFGAALDRYFLVNGKLGDLRRECRQAFDPNWASMKNFVDIPNSQNTESEK